MYSKKEQIISLSQKLETTQRSAEVIYDAFVQMITEGLLSEGKIKVGDIATFEIKDSPSRVCRNPKDGSEVIVPEKKKVSVKVSSSLKTLVNE